MRPSRSAHRAFPSLGGLGRFARGHLQLCRVPWPWALLFPAPGEPARAGGQPARCLASSEWPWGVSRPHLRAPRSMKSCWKTCLRQSEREGGLLSPDHIGSLPRWEPLTHPHPSSHCFPSAGPPPMPPELTCLLSDAQSPPTPARCFVGTRGVVFLPPSQPQSLLSKLHTPCGDPQHWRSSPAGPCIPVPSVPAPSSVLSPAPPPMAQASRCFHPQRWLPSSP